MLESKKQKEFLSLLTKLELACIDIGYFGDDSPQQKEAIQETKKLRSRLVRLVNEME